MKKDKTISWIVIVVIWIAAFCTLVPLVYCGFFDYATGDDLGKSARVHQVILNGGGIIDVIRQAISSAHETYMNHEGTWASNFILALQPSIWGEKFYIVTPFLGMVMLGIGTALFLYEVIVRKLHYPKSFYWLIFPAFYVLAIQYMPFIRGGLYWYTGMAHYVFPLTGALLYMVLISRYYETGKMRYIVGALFLSIYIGGSHYQAFLLSVLLFLLFTFLSFGEMADKKRVVLGFVSQIFQIVGFVICYKAPGNNQRAEAEFGFSFERAVNTVFDSIVQSTMDGINYFIHVRPLIALTLILVLAGIIYGNVFKLEAKRALLIVIYSYLVYCAMYSPGLYYASYGASEGISGGYYDVNYFCFLIYIVVISLIIGGFIHRIYKKSVIKHTFFNAVGIIFLLLMVILSKYIIGNSSGYTCYNFISEGHLKDYVSQMEERIDILEDDSIQEVVLPEMNDQQGPFMHMALTPNPDSFTNWVTREFYGKKSVVAIPRDEYYQKYGK